MKLVLKVSIVSECVFTIIKLAQDALKELVRIKSCKYESLVATHLKCIVQDKLRFTLVHCVLQFLMNKYFDVGQVYFNC